MRLWPRGEGACTRVGHSRGAGGPRKLQEPDRTDLGILPRVSVHKARWRIRPACVNSSSPCPSSCGTPGPPYRR
eukprot:5085476-Pyramimonas_sp.AAC.1